MSKKVVQNLSTSIKLNLKDEKGVTTEKIMTYFDMIKSALDTPPKEGGFSRAEMKARNKIEDKLIGESAEFEHDEFHYLKGICNSIYWFTKHRDLEGFLNYLDDVK